VEILAFDDSKLIVPANPELPDDTSHKVDLPDGRWSLWRWAALRGTGFPVDMLLELGAAACARSADELNKKQQNEEANRQVAIKLIQQAMIEEGHARPSARKAFKVLKNRTFVNTLSTHEEVHNAASQWLKSLEAFNCAGTYFKQEFDQATAQVSESLRNFAERKDFREAVTWQNRKAMKTGIDALLRKKPGVHRGSKYRQHEQLVANYIQRYCAKNDTIGFFGPVGWANFVSTGPALRAHCGSFLISKRNLYFESWCIDALVESYQYRQEVLPWVAPRRNCTVYECEGKMHFPYGTSITLKAIEQEVLALCDGERLANDIANVLVQDPHVDLHSATEVFTLLDDLKSKEVIWWKFELSRELRPEIALHKTIQKIDDTQIQLPLKAALEEMQEAFDRVKASVGDPDEVSRSLRDLEATFNRLTGHTATRSAGGTYAGRTLVYEDCVRDTDLEVGPEILADIGPALNLVLDSARWLSFAIWYTYEKIIRKHYTSLTESTGSSRVDFVQLWARIQPYFFERRDEVASAAQAQFQKRWAKILDLSSNTNRLNYCSGELKRSIFKEFSTPERPTSLPRYHSPDLMFSAKDIDAFNRKEYQAVLGELHAGINTLSCPLFFEQHPTPEDLFKAVEADFSEPRVHFIVPKGSWGDLTRLFPALTSPQDYYLALHSGPSQIDETKRIPIGELVVEQCDGELKLHTRDKQVTLGLMTGLGQLIEVVTAGQFKICDAPGHTPRITIDKLVVSRESWRFEVKEAVFAFNKEEAERYSQARKWVLEKKLPRFVFVKFSGEFKPVFIDFTSPVYIEIFSKLVRRAVSDQGQADASFTLTEMLPGIEDCWLPDAANKRYTCELRMVAVEQLSQKKCGGQ
tara:strand:- start:37568 stop:40162 length:2595 start_codon:yes stop_codon:yes gene_type:complete